MKTNIKSVVGCLGLVAALFASPVMAETYKCPSKIKIDQQSAHSTLSADMRSGRYSTDAFTIAADPRLAKGKDWAAHVTLDQPKRYGRCDVNTWVVQTNGVNALVCECTDPANDVTFTVAKSVTADTCKTTGKLGFLCTN
ncbi:hypothetical protein V5T82_11465 [Magnetovibrio sp. PR-2]|uniref:hypothetical protein n=1 Tax=Magnetovibrio sp. PR-2 TaxID=3120356 RepID=UPI002FCE4687